jgi:hypothetical protein
MGDLGHGWNVGEHVLVRATREAGIVREVRDEHGLRWHRLESAPEAPGPPAMPRGLRDGAWYLTADLDREQPPTAREAATVPDEPPGPEVTADAVTAASWESFPASDAPGWR